MTPARFPKYHRGFATLIALAVLPLVAVALLLLVRLATDEARLYRHQADEAQLQQLVLAGIAAAEARGAELGEGLVPLPPELGEASLTVRLVPAGGGPRAALVHARVRTLVRRENIALE
jgi:hypothetical protein